MARNKTELSYTKGKVLLATASVAEPPKSLGPPTVVLVQQTLDNPARAPDHLTSSVSVFFTFAQERFTRDADITTHRRNEYAEAVIITLFYFKVEKE
jgi:hypothetical protein